MRVCAGTDIAAPIEAVFELAADPERALSYMSGVTRWEVAGDRAQGLGARYRMLMRVGSAEIGGLIEIVEWNPPRDFAWVSVTGVDQRGRMRLRPRGRDRTHVEFRLAYGVAGAGIGGWLAEKVAARPVGAHMRRTVRGLKRLVEYEQLRARAASRRAARGSRAA